MTGTNQIYAKDFKRKKFYGDPSCNSVYNHHTERNTHDDPKIGERIERLLSDEDLNQSTRDFVSSLQEFFSNKKFLTEKQLNALVRVESRFSSQEKEKLKSWRKEYQEKHLIEATILADYYKVEGYWLNVAQAILNDKEYVPPRHTYHKMSTNKYAQQVLRNFYAEPKFAKGSLVQIRSTVGNTTVSWHLKDFRNRLAFVIEHDPTFLSSVKGGKGYKILPMGHGTPIRAEERNLMKPNKRGVSA